MIFPSPTTTSQHDERLIHWLSALHDALPAERVPLVFADKKTTLARRIALLERVFEHIIHLTNELNAFDPTSRKIAIPRSVCEVYPDRKTQQTQITLRLKQILDLRNAAQHSTSDTLEAAHGRIQDLNTGIEKARTGAAGTSKPTQTAPQIRPAVRRTERSRRAYTKVHPPRHAPTSAELAHWEAGMQQIRSQVPGGHVRPTLPTETSHPGQRQYDGQAISAPPPAAGQNGWVGKCALPSIGYVLRWEAFGRLERSAGGTGR
ncbi:hypothetical protein B0H14DRAFT_2741059 [Mycena olivaceomarginata]|nr:hypothetical protein B0H14DRAFT_2741059 [Mycena olivaceomarginata]